MTLYPGQSLVNNIGYGKNATHCNIATNVFNSDLLERPCKLESIPVEENSLARTEIIKFFRKLPFKLGTAWILGLIRYPFQKSFL
jgi:hypothetical protein